MYISLKKSIGIWVFRVSPYPPIYDEKKSLEIQKNFVFLTSKSG